MQVSILQRGMSQLLWSLLLGSLSVFGQNNTLKFDHIDLEDGISQSVVTSMVQDRSGFLWFGTQDGLNRFDGYQFKVFRAPNDPGRTGLSSSGIQSLFIDRSGKLWVGTDLGLDYYDEARQSFETATFPGPTHRPFNNMSIEKIFEDFKGNLWIYTFYDGLFLTNPEAGILRHWPRDASDPEANVARDVYCFYQYSDNEIWLGLGTGLAAYNYEKDLLEKKVFSPNSPYSLEETQVSAILDHPAGGLLIAADHQLLRYDTETQSLSLLVDENGVPFGPTSVTIRNAYLDSENTLWLGNNLGVIQIDKNLKNQREFSYNPSNPHSMGRDVLSIFEDSSGVIWIGTYSDGLVKLNRNSRHFMYYRHDPNLTSTMAGPSLRTLFVDQDNRLWAGHFEEGLNVLDSAKNTFKRIGTQENNPTSLPSNSILHITQTKSGTMLISTLDGLAFLDSDGAVLEFWDDRDTSPVKLISGLVYASLEDQDGFIWLGTNSGVQVIGPNRQEVNRFQVNPTHPNKGLIQKDVMSIYQDGKGFYWMATFGGVSRFDPLSQTFSNYRHDFDDPYSLCHNVVMAFTEDSNGHIWIGTGHGLNRYLPETDQFMCYGADENFPNLTIYGILEAPDRHLWLSTNSGLIRFNPETRTFQSFDSADGLQSNEFNQGAFVKSKDGRFFFGGINGITAFYPDDIHLIEAAPSLILTDFLVRNQPVIPGTEKGPLKKPIHLSDSLSLPYREYLFAFEFSTLDFSSPQKAQFAYMMEGLDQNWVFTDKNNRRATYTKLQPGTYKFLAKTANSSGNWQAQPTSISIQILPPFYRTIWAYIFYVLLAGSIFFGIYAWRIHEVKAELLRERVVNERLQQLNRLKDDFLANTSHELRTPLNGIIGLAESLRDGSAGPLPPKADHNLKLIVKSSERLSHLVNDLLDFSSLKSHAIQLQKAPVDLRSLTDVVVTILNPLAQKKHLQLLNLVPKDLKSVEADESRLQQILFNLVGNAIKFTEKGKVSITADQTGERILVSVADSGPGIPDHEKELIFESFERGSIAEENAVQGTGLGLALSKHLVSLHGGTICVENNPDGGATFQFDLPISGEAAKPSVFNPNTASSFDLTFDTSEIGIRKDEVLAETNQANKDFRLLIVDDDPINRQVLLDHLALQYRHVVTATNGHEALEIIEAGTPFDLIILDIMMPLMSGYEVCRRLRKSFPIHELPVIFLTAKNQIDDLVSGYDAGGNDYLTKPVTKMELLQRVQTQIRLLDANRNLESKVEERTQQLKSKNEELAILNKALEEASFTDPLTLLGNRRYLRKYLDKEVALVNRIYNNWRDNENLTAPDGNDLLFLLFDLDHFKLVNDTYGHLAGDKVLQQIKTIMEKVSREYDILVRWGGEEFLIVFRSAIRSHAKDLAERLRKTVAEFPFDIGGNDPLFLTASIGIAAYPFHTGQPKILTWEQVIDVADQALYLAKKNSRNAWVAIDSSPSTQTDNLLEMIRTDFAELVANGSLSLETSLDSSQITRWEKDRKKSLSP